MYKKIKRQWETIRNSPPGQRFQERYRQQQSKRVTGKNRHLAMFSGCVVILLGMLLWFLPGPGWITIIVGAGIIAGESIAIARILDWLDFKISYLLDSSN